MKTNLTNKVMRRIAEFEKRRIIIWGLSLVVIGLSLVVIGSVWLGGAGREIVELGTHELVIGLAEDFGVIWVIWEELPKDKLLYGLLAGGLVGLIIWEFGRRWLGIKRKMRDLTKYLVRS